MNKWLKRYFGALAAFAMVVTTFVAKVIFHEHEFMEIQQDEKIFEKYISTNNQF